ncbi:MAG: hypothetical protein AMXMBFR59_27900 [Rhodanobacteraceae bacterium]
MKARAVVTVLIASFVFVAGAAIESANREAPAPVAAAAPATPKVAPERVATLVVLPEISVRPSAEDLALAYAEPLTETQPEVDSVPDSPNRTRAGTGRGAFDMPYYSFGKVLPQVSQD